MYGKTILVLGVFCLAALSPVPVWSQDAPDAPVSSGTGQYTAEIAHANNAAVAAYEAGNYEEALSTWTSLAKDGNPVAEINLGLYYAEGMAGPADLSMAVSWYRKAADQGIRTAQMRLVKLYAGGHDGPKDYIECYKWLNLAIAADTDAEERKADIELRDQLTGLMSPAQLTEAEVLVAEWKPVPWAPAQAETRPSAQVPVHHDPDITLRLAAGVAAYNNRDYKQALALWRPLADQGDSHAQANIGVMYAEGLGVQRDYTMALALFQKSARQGLPEGQISLSGAYEEGQGVPKDYAMAVYWARRAAEQGMPDAQDKLGDLYFEGDGQIKSYFVPKFAAGVEWYRKAAESGYFSAQMELGNVYSDGIGVPKDEVSALKWYSLAVVSAEDAYDRKIAAKKRDRLTARMTEAQKAEADAQVKARKPMAPLY